MAPNEVSAMRRTFSAVVWTNQFIRSLLVSTVLAVLGLPSAQASRHLTQPDAIHFELYSDYLIVVHGSVRGSAGPVKDLNFLVDTGTSPTILSPRLAQRLHLDPTPAVVAAVGGNVQGEIATIPSLQIGPILSDNLPVLIRDLTTLQPILPIQIDGIVGIDVLGQSSFVIDYATHTISFGPTPSLPTSIPLHLEDGLPIVDATLNHTPAHLVLDTGAAALVLFAPTPAPQPTSAPQLIRASLPKSLNHVEHKPIRLDRFELGPSSFGHEPAFLVANPVDAGHHYDGLLSPTALGITQLAIDPTHHTFAFTRTP